MTEENLKSFQPRALPRIPLKLRVNMEFEKFSGFISEYSENVSEGGMFVKTTTPRPVGSVFSLEFKLKDDYKLIQGWGEVVWVREKSETPDKAAGMGIKFLDLDQASRELIRNIIRIHKKETGNDKIHPFEFMKEPSDQEADIEKKKGKKIDLSTLAKEVFDEKANVAKEDSKNAGAIVDDIFRNIKSEIELDKESKKGTTPNAITNASLVAETLSAKPQGPSESGKPISPSDESNFVEEVFGKDKPPKGSDATFQKTVESIKEKVKERDTYKRVKWHSDPSNVIILLIILVLLSAALYYHEKITKTALLIKSHYTEGSLLPFFKPKLEKAETKKIVTESPQKVSINVPTTVATSQTAIQDEPKPNVTPALTDMSKEPESPSIEIKAKIKEPTKTIGVENVKLERYKSGAMRVTFSFTNPFNKESLDHELLPSPSRLLVKVAGINKPYKRHEFNIANSNLKRIRMGLHSNPDSLYIVFDLGSSITQDLINVENIQNGFSITVGQK